MSDELLETLEFLNTFQCQACPYGSNCFSYSLVLIVSIRLHGFDRQTHGHGTDKIELMYHRSDYLSDPSSTLPHLNIAENEMSDPYEFWRSLVKVLNATNAMIEVDECITFKLLHR